MSGRHGKKHKNNGNPQIKPESGQLQPESTEATEPAKAAPESTGDSATNDHERFSARWIRKPEPFDVALIGLVLTFVIAVIYYFQLRSMQDSVKMTGIALEADQRP